MEDTMIELSVVMPCLNEEEGIGICIDKIKDVFSKYSIKGEIIVSDNGSLDNSVEIASKKGARVVKESQPGYGAAYLRGLSEAKGKYIIMADSDNTYDFYEIPKFLDKLKEGFDFIMGSRFRGTIHKDAMPWAHRYFGNPVLSGMTRLFFKVRLSDIHCGMRAFTADAYKKMSLTTLGMEFATEMVVSALMNKLKTCEIPINYFPRAGKSKLVPLSDAWRHIRFMLLYCPLWLYFVPGIIGFISGMALLLLLLKGPVLLLGHNWDMHPLVFGSAITILSFQILNIGVFAHVYAINQGLLVKDRFSAFLEKHFNLEKGLFLGVMIFSAGFAINLLIFLEWFYRHFGALYRIREAVLAMTLLVIGLQTIFSSFFISLLYLRKK